MVRDGTPRGARAADAVGDTAEVVFLGELTGATGFKHTCRGSVLCKYVVVHGEHWHLAKGAVSGATQAAATSGDGGELAPWGHPFQLSFNATSVQVRHTRAPKMGAHAPHAEQPMAPRPTNGPLVARCFYENASRRASRVREQRARPPPSKKTCVSFTCVYVTHTIPPRTTSPPSYQGWPKLLFAVYERDATALVDSFVGYGVAALPLSPGAHDVSACVFVANDRNARLAQSARDYFTAARPELEGWRAQMLRREEMHAAPVVTKGMGTIHMKIAVLSKNLHISGLHVKPVPRGDRRAGGRSPRAARGPRGDRSPSPVRPNAEDTRRGLDSVRRRFADAAAASSPARSESDASVAEGGFGARRARRAADAFSAAAALGRAGAPGGEAAAPGGRRARHARASAGDATAALVSARRAEQEQSAKNGSGGAGGDATSFEAAPRFSASGAPSAATFAHQREAIEDAPLASGRDARRALREARMSQGEGSAHPNPGGRRSRGS